MRVLTGEAPVVGISWRTGGLPGLGLVLLAAVARDVEVRHTDGMLPQVFLSVLHMGESIWLGNLHQLLTFLSF